MRGEVREAGSRDVARRDDEVARHRQVAIEALPNLNAVALGGDYVGETPNRDAAPAVFVREEVPVRHEVAEGRVADVVGREAESINAQQRLAGAYLAGVAAHAISKFDGLEAVAANAEVGHLLSIASRA